MLHDTTQQPMHLRSLELRLSVDTEGPGLQETHHGTGQVVRVGRRGPQRVQAAEQ
jgi:hypothetical protein